MYTVNPPNVQLRTDGLQAVMLIYPLMKPYTETVAMLRCGMTTGICNISVELLKTGDDAVLQSGNIRLDCKRGMIVSLSARGKGTVKTTTVTRAGHCLV